MKRLIKSTLRKVATKAIESKSFKSRNGELVVLMYHGIVKEQPNIPDWCLVTAENFESQLIELKRHFNILPLSEAIQKLQDGEIDGPTAAITFDDGYKNNHDLAWPVLERLEVPATIYLSTNLIDSQSSIWTARLQSAFCQTLVTVLNWRQHAFNLSTIDGKKTAVSSIKKILKTEHYQVIADETALIEKALFPKTEAPKRIIEDYQILSSVMIKEMATSNLIEFGAHTLNHPILSRLSREEQTMEISQSVDRVGELTGKPCTLFAYPNGSREDYSDITVEILEQLSINCSFSTSSGVNTKATPKHEMVRYGVGNNADFLRELYSMYK